MKLQTLTAPITANEIEWRIQSAKNGMRIVVPYVTARAIMNRFDAEFGPHQWKSEFARWGDHSVKCRISVIFKHEDRLEWVYKEDGADDSKIESTKGGFSDSLKRCAVQWGVGRDLYDYPTIQVEGENRYLEFEVVKKLNAIAEGLASGKNFGSYIKVPLK